MKHNVVAFPASTRSVTPSVRRVTPEERKRRRQVMLAFLNDMQVLAIAQPSAFQRVISVAADLANCHRAAHGMKQTS